MSTSIHSASQRSTLVWGVFLKVPSCFLFLKLEFVFDDTLDRWKDHNDGLLIEYIFEWKRGKKQGEGEQSWFRQVRHHIQVRWVWSPQILSSRNESRLEARSRILHNSSVFHVEHHKRLYPFTAGTLFCGSHPLSSASRNSIELRVSSFRSNKTYAISCRITSSERGVCNCDSDRSVVEEPGAAMVASRTRDKCTIANCDTHISRL